MDKKYKINPIGYIYNGYNEKFGIPRQSGLAESVISKIIFEKEYSSYEYFKGIEEFSHLWLLWHFSETADRKVSPSVRPPKLGGNTYVGVFASRSPFRPNHIGLSSVKLEKIEIESSNSIVLYVSGADIKNETPILDIKPYLPYTDIHNNALSGYSKDKIGSCLEVIFDENTLSDISDAKKREIEEILSQDPRPSYHNDKTRIYGLNYSEYNIKFKVDKTRLYVCDISKNQ